jgi:hypothetical protein
VERFELIGECYVHGMMAGEAFKSEMIRTVSVERSGLFKGYGVTSFIIFTIPHH